MPRSRSSWPTACGSRSTAPTSRSLPGPSGGAAPPPGGHPNPAAAWAAWWTCALVWGSTYLFISFGNDALPPVWAASLRLMLAAAILAVVALLLRHPFPRGAALRATLHYGVLQFGVNFALLYWGEKTFPSGLTAVLYATIPLSTAIMAAATGLERLTPAKVAGAVVALGGVALLFAGQPLGGVGLVPAAALFTAATLAAWSGLVLKRGPRQSPVWATAVGSLAGLAVCLAVSFAVGEAHPLPVRFEQWFPVVYLTLAGSVAAFVLFAWLINHWPVTRVSFIGVVNPLVALALGWAFRDERLTLASLAGSALVLLGLVFGLRPEKGARAPGATKP